MRQAILLGVDTHVGESNIQGEDDDSTPNTGVPWRRLGARDRGGAGPPPPGHRGSPADGGRAMAAAAGPGSRGPSPPTPVIVGRLPPVCMSWRRLWGPQLGIYCLWC